MRIHATSKNGTKLNLLSMRIYDFNRKKKIVTLSSKKTLTTHFGVAQTYLERHLVSNYDRNDIEMAILATSKNGAYLNLLSTWTHDLYIGGKKSVNAVDAGAAGYGFPWRSLEGCFAVVTPGGLLSRHRGARARPCAAA